MLGYDPRRLGPLRARAAAALRHLLAVRSDDPAAASAVRVSAAVRAHLEQQWLPAIDRLVASDAMTSWVATAAASALERSGGALGVALAEQATDLLAWYDERRANDLLAALRVAAGDDAAASAFVETLGPAGLLQLVTVLATVDPSSIALPSALRELFVSVAASDALPPDFGRDLVRAAAAAHERWGRTGDAGLALSFLFHGGDVPEDVLVDVVDEVIAQELAFAEREGLDPSTGWSFWLGNGAAAALGLWSDFDEPLRGGDLDPMEARDPMYALLGQLSRNGAAGRAVFTDPPRAQYLFAQRDVLADGGRAIVAAASTAAAGPDVVPTASVVVLDRASLVASAFVNLFGPVNAARVDRDDGTAIAAARIVGAHLYGVDHALGWGRGPTDADRSGSEPGAADPWPAGTDRLSHQVFAGSRSAAVFEPHALGQVLDLAARTDAGVEVLRADLATYQRGIAAEAASRVASGDIPPSEAESYLEEAMQDAARLEGQFVQHVGREAERRGLSQDRARSLWIAAVGEGAEHAGNLFGPAGSAILDTVVEPLTDAMRDALGDAADRATAEGERLAAVAGEQLAYLWFRELYAAGLLSPDIPADLLVDGELPSYNDMVVALESGDRPGWTMSTVMQELDDAPGGVVDVDGREMIESMTAAQEDLYRGVGG
jgi:hypothetical protein